MVSMPGNLIIRAGLPFESRCFDHYWHTQFQVFEIFQNSFFNLLKVWKTVVKTYFYLVLLVSQCLFLDFLAHSSHIMIIYNNL